MSDTKDKYKISFGGGQDEGEWKATTIIEASGISDAVKRFEKVHEGSCSEWGAVTVFSIELQL